MDKPVVLKRCIDLVLITMTAGILLAAAGPVRADIYTWKDADGILHFSNHNPPAEARFLMAEHVAARNPEPAPEKQKPVEKTDALKARLEEANRKLDAALDQVQDLSRQVEDTRREAAAAAEAARRAAAEAAARETPAEKTVVFGLPYHRRPDHPPRPTPYYWHLDSARYPYYHDGNAGAHHHVPPATSGVSVNIRRSGGSLTAGTVPGRQYGGR